MPPLICTAQQGPGKSPNPSEWFALTQHYARARRLPYESYYHICSANMQAQLVRDFELGSVDTWIIEYLTAVHRGVKKT